jgi:glucokinase
MEKLPLRDLLSKRLKLPIVLGNDVQIGTYAEHRFGAARGFCHVQGVFFGTGVGGGLILDGRVCHGAYGLAGQVGCLLAHATCEAREVEVDGMLDRIASKASIFGAAIGLAAKDWAPALRKQVGTDLGELEWHILAASVKAGDRQIEQLLRTRLHTVGAVLSNVVNFVGPEIVVLGGGLTEDLPQIVFHEVDRGMRARLVRPIAKKLRIVPGQLENKAVAMGAAKLAFDFLPAEVRKA